MTPEASILGILLKEAGASRRNGRMSGVVKQGRFVILRCALFCSIWGSQITQMLGKTARKGSLSHPFLCVCPKR